MANSLFNNREHFQGHHRRAAGPQRRWGELLRGGGPFAPELLSLAELRQRPRTKLQAFLRHIGALLGKGSTAEQIDGAVQKLEKSGLVRVAGDLVLYGEG